MNTDGHEYMLRVFFSRSTLNWILNKLLRQLDLYRHRPPAHPRELDLGREYPDRELELDGFAE